ncbi:hypothetical protein [Microbacterium enclense]|uniref:hypothetical protein n=1 Tax=Microbacterium enclense TaxID=993073 RepID=UPI003F7FC933
MVVFVMTLVGAALGLVLARATVPRTKRPLAACTFALTLLSAGALLWLDPANLGAALAFVSVLLLTLALCAAARWKSLMPALGRNFGWFFWVAAVRPDYLRSIYSESAPDVDDGHADRRPQ